jgi:DNA-binding MarR family transcriptional regulator
MRGDGTVVRVVRRRHPESAGSSGGGAVAPETVAAVERGLAAAAWGWSEAGRSRELQLSPMQQRVFETVSRRGDTNLGGLAADLGLIPSSASRLCDRLEAAGLIVREAARADRREITVRLSVQGKRLYAEITERRREFVARALAGLSATARARLLDTLTEFGRASDLLPSGEAAGEDHRTA